MSTLDLFKEVFYLDESSPSYLRWKISPSTRFKAGSVAGNQNRHGYWYVRYKGVTYPVAKVVLSLSNDEYFDQLTAHHIDYCPSNNTPSNLRWEDRSGQNANRRLWGFKTMDNNLNDFEKSKAIT